MVTTQMTTAARTGAALDAVARASSAGVTAVMGRVRSLAVRTITVHVDNVGVCMVCGSHWPCGLARLAEHNLAVL